MDFLVTASAVFDRLGTTPSVLTITRAVSFVPIFSFRKSSRKCMQIFFVWRSQDFCSVLELEFASVTSVTFDDMSVPQVPGVYSVLCNFTMFCA